MKDIKKEIAKAIGGCWSGLAESFAEIYLYDKDPKRPNFNKIAEQVYEQIIKKTKISC